MGQFMPSPIPSYAVPLPLPGASTGEYSGPSAFVRVFVDYRYPLLIYMIVLIHAISAGFIWKKRGGGAIYFHFASSIIGITLCWNGLFPEVFQHERWESDVSNAMLGYIAFMTLSGAAFLGDYTNILKINHKYRK